MHFHHLHFYVQDTAVWQKWFGHKLAFHPVTASSQPVRLIQDGIEIRLSSPRQNPDVASYLTQHPPGLVDVAFATEQFDAVLSHAQRQGAALCSAITTDESGHRHCQLEGWAHLRHTLVEVDASWVSAHCVLAPEVSPLLADGSPVAQSAAQSPLLSMIDHVVINVPQGELDAAIGWYQTVFGLQLGQTFEINTAHSGLRSQVLDHPEGSLQLPINEPTSANSQIQEFLHHNRGAGVQHVALRSQNAIDAIAHFRKQGLKLLEVPTTYYDDLHTRADCPLGDLSAIAQQQLLLDWSQGGEQGMLLQTFTQPIFSEPTFFFEIIERSHYQAGGQMKSAKGFGEGNFQALFEAIERAQIERGSLA